MDMLLRWHWLLGTGLLLLTSPTPIRFELARVPFTLQTGEDPRERQKYMPGPMPGGLAIFDYNGDGRPDLFFTNAAPVTTLRKGGSPQYRNRLFRNDGDGFTDVTLEAGLAGTGFDIGAAVADYDNNGHPDLFVAGVHRSTLYHNNGDGTFTDVTERAGIDNGPDPRYGPRWAVAAAWVDVNNDGLLDLFIVQYLQWSARTEIVCGAGVYCSPRAYGGMPNRLLLNRGAGRFDDVSEQWGIRQHVGKGMGVGVADFDHDGLSDLYVTNDTERNFLFHNTKAGRFEEVAFPMGAALVEDGGAISGMGLDFRDVNNDGFADLAFVALEKQTFPLFLNLGGKGFREVTYASGMRQATLDRAGWGAVFADLDNDGRKELFTSCGDVVDQPFPGKSGNQFNAVFRQLAEGKWMRVSEAGAGLTAAAAARHRGLALADLDGDGRLDAVTTALEAPAEVWMNRSNRAGRHWLAIQLQGTQSNRDGIGARIRVRGAASGEQRFNHMTSSTGYASSNLGPVHFGMAGDGVAAEVEIHWPSGVVQTLHNVPCDRVLRLVEGI